MWVMGAFSGVPGHRSVVDRVTVGGDRAVGAGQPVAARVGGGGHAHHRRPAPFRARPAQTAPDRGRGTGRRWPSPRRRGRRSDPGSTPGRRRGCRPRSGSAATGSPWTAFCVDSRAAADGRPAERIAEDLDRPGLVGAAGHAHPDIVVGGTELVLAVGGRLPCSRRPSRRSRRRARSRNPRSPELAAKAHTWSGDPVHVERDGSATVPVAARWADHAWACGLQAASTWSWGTGTLAVERAARSAFTRATRSWA